MRVVPAGSATVASPGMGTAAYRRSSASSSRITPPAVHGMRISLKTLDAFIPDDSTAAVEVRPETATPRAVSLRSCLEHTFDFILCFGILHRVENPIGLLKAL